MKTLKALKITSVFQAIYCLFCFVPIIFLAIGDNTGVFSYTDIGIFLFGLNVINPTVLVSFLINTSKFSAEKRTPEQKKIIGFKWIGIFVWPVVTTIFFTISGLLFIKYTGGV